jgi:hypothetical protein
MGLAEAEAARTAMKAEVRSVNCMIDEKESGRVEERVCI